MLGEAVFLGGWWFFIKRIVNSDTLFRMQVARSGNKSTVMGEKKAEKNDLVRDIDRDLKISYWNYF